MSARLLVAMAIVAYTASAIKHKLETQQEKGAPARREEEEPLIDRAAIAQIGKSKLVYYLILAGSGAPGPRLLAANRSAVPPPPQNVPFPRKGPTDKSPLWISSPRLHRRDESPRLPKTSSGPT